MDKQIFFGSAGLATNTFLFSQPTAQNNNTNFRLHEIPWVIIIIGYL